MRTLLTTRTAKSARARRSLTLLGALILLALAGWAIVASAAPSVATPRIASGPTGATSATSASFSFTVGARGDTTECSLDGSAYATCTSPKTYAGLREGTHTFNVRDRNPRLGAGNPATRTWTIDTTPPPAPALTQKPAAVTSLDHATFAYTDAEAGVSWACRVDGHDWTSCTDPVSWWGLHDGVRTFTVRARDAAGNVGAATSYSWIVDTVAPPKPQLTQQPPNPSASSSATFAFADREAGAAFECSLDGGAYAACTSPQTYDGLSNANHRFDVRALDAAGNRSGVTEATWRVAAGTSGLPFTISGGYGGLLYPGRTGVLALRVANPNGVPIVVTSLTVAIQPGSSKAGCDGPSNLVVAQSNVSATNALSVPANGSVTLPSGAVSAPSVTMRDLPTNQDACKGAVFTFAYGGSSHS